MIELAPFNEDDFKQLQSWYINETNVAGESDAFVFKAVHIETLETVGHISLGGLSWKNRSARISRVMISPEHVGKGYCKPMVKASLKIGFEELQLHRIGLGVYTHNQSAIKCYEGAGLVSEGIQRDVLWTGTEYWSMQEMAILEDDWKKLNV